MLLKHLAVAQVNICKGGSVKGFIIKYLIEVKKLLRTGARKDHGLAKL